MAWTEITRVNLRGKTVIQYAGDLAASDNTIHTPQAGNQVFLMGAIFSEGTATNITWKSGSTTIVTPEQASNQGVWDRVSADGYYIATVPGQALVANPSAAVSSAMITIYEGPSF